MPSARRAAAEHHYIRRTGKAVLTFVVNRRTGYKTRPVLMREMSMNTHNELFARFVAYSSPYLFWVCVGVVLAGILWLR
jgi:hypothetical protein